MRYGKKLAGEGYGKRKKCRRCFDWFSIPDGKVLFLMGIGFLNSFPYLIMEKLWSFRPMEKGWKRRTKTSIVLIENLWYWVR